MTLLIFDPTILLFPSSFSHGVFANIGSGAVPGRLLGGRFREVPGQVLNHGLREGSGAGSERQVPGRFRGRFRTTGSGKVPGQALNDSFRAGSEPRSEPRVKVPGQVPNQVPTHEFRGGFRGRFRTTFRTTGSGKVPGQVPIHEFRDFRGRF